jgi:hypothetical protein
MSEGFAKEAAAPRMVSAKGDEVFLSQTRAQSNLVISRQTVSGESLQRQQE